MGYSFHFRIFENAGKKKKDSVWKIRVLQKFGNLKKGSPCKQGKE
jgi:hypothetical protein